jgi:hypothetical protein
MAANGAQVSRTNPFAQSQSGMSGSSPPHGRACMVCACRTSPVGNRKRRADYRTLGRTVYEPIPNNGPNVASVGTKDLFSPNASDNLSRAAIDVVTRHLKRSPILRV